MISRIMCFLGMHDWREMNGKCRMCHKVDEYQADYHDAMAAAAEAQGYGEAAAYHKDIAANCRSRK